MDEPQWGNPAAVAHGLKMVATFLLLASLPRGLGSLLVFNAVAKMLVAPLFPLTNGQTGLGVSASLLDLTQGHKLIYR